MKSKTPTILLVKDDSRDVKLTLRALEEWVLLNKVLVLSDCEAMDYFYHRGEFANGPFGSARFVLLDLKRPKARGLDVLKTLKNDRDLKSIPVIVLTSSREAGDLRECYQHGVNAYVIKPTDAGEFIWTVKQLVNFWSTINEPPLYSRRL